jgi:hypothetical protein
MNCLITKINNNTITSDIKFYPNPFNSQVTFNFNKFIDGKIYVYETSGKLIFEDNLNSESYNLNSLKFKADYNGLLFVRIISRDETLNFKLIKTN